MILKGLVRAESQTRNGTKSAVAEELESLSIERRDNASSGFQVSCDTLVGMMTYPTVLS